MTQVIGAPLARMRGLAVPRGTIAFWWLGQAGFAIRAAELLILDRKSTRLNSSH